MGEVKARTLKRAGAWRQELKQRPWRSAATGVLLMAFFICFLFNSGSPAQGQHYL